jgi:Protein of unknown function (DUF1573)
MRMHGLRVLVCGLALVVSGSRVALAQGQGQFDPLWADKLFEKLEHDFGIVPSNADLKFRIKITNHYKQTVNIAGVASSCGCTAGKLAKNTLASEESTYIDLSMDTRRFRGLKETKVTVTFNQPLFANVVIQVKAFINPDLMLNPGAAEFGSIPKGSDRALKMAVSFNGRGQFSIKDATCKNPNVVAKLVDLRQNPFNQQYELHVTIKGATPLGDLREQVILTTDDPNQRSVPVLVEAKVEPEFTVSPELVSFGTMSPGERKAINIVVRSNTKKPFSIEKIESEKTAGVFETRLPKDIRETHVLPLTIIAPKEAGPVNEEFTVTLGGSTEPITFKAYAKVVAAAAPASGAPVPQNP